MVVLLLVLLMTMLLLILLLAVLPPPSLLFLPGIWLLHNIILENIKLFHRQGTISISIVVFEQQTDHLIIVLILLSYIFL